MGCVYLITSPSGKRYVGATRHDAQTRWKRHVKDSAGTWSALYAAIRKYGPEAFSVETLEEHDDFADIARAEVRLIAQLGTMFPGGYNLTPGGEGVVALPSEIEARRVANSAASRQGLKLTAAHRAALSESHKGLPSPRKGQTHSIETRALMSAAAKARAARTPREEMIRKMAHMRAGGAS